MMKVLSRLLCLVLCLPLLVMGQEKITWEKDGKEMVLIPAGSFEMGDHHDNMSSALPVHTVTLDEFYMDSTEVTNGQYRVFMEQTGHRQPGYWTNSSFNHANQPVVGVDWYDAMAYTAWAGKRLPTEAEWEYAARGDLIGKRYPWGDEGTTAGKANYDRKVGKAAVVGSYPANGYGLYDMAGNVREWCLDKYDGSYYRKSAAVNPLSGHDSIEALTSNYENVSGSRVLRGGDWNDDTGYLRVADRDNRTSINKGDNLGFRCVLGSNFTPDSSEGGVFTRIEWGKDNSQMALIPAGSFEMGDSKSEPEDWMKRSRPVHKVQLDAFYTDVHEVTVGQFREFVNQNGYNYNRWTDVAKYSPGDEYPMVYVDWNDATAYAKWAGKRLPTEAEWEYAARGGLVGKRYPWGNEIGHDNANYSGTSGKDKWSKCAPVGSFRANGYGLYDMSGNVWEWCSDWYSENYYSSSPSKNPRGPGSGSSRVLRGAGWYGNTDALRVADRVNDAPTLRHYGIGFRCVLGLNFTLGPSAGGNFTPLPPVSFAVGGRVSYLDGEVVNNGISVKVTNLTRGLSQISQTDNNGKYAVTFVATNEVTTMAKVGDILNFSADGLNQSTSEYTITGSDIAHGSVTFGLKINLNPILTGVSPERGSTKGDTLLTLKGTNFFSATTKVKVGGKRAQNIKVQSARQLTCLTPSGPAGLVAVEVYNSADHSTQLDQAFKYESPVTSSMEVTTAKKTLTANGVATSRITVKLLDQHSTPISDETVDLVTDLGTITATAKSLGDGTYRATYTASQKAGPATITAVTNTSGVSGQVVISLQPQQVSADKSTAVLDRKWATIGLEKAVLTIKLLDLEGLPMDGQTVSVSLTAVAGMTISLIKETDQKGQTQVEISSQSKGKQTLTIKVDEVVLDTKPVITFISDQVAGVAIQVGGRRQVGQLVKVPIMLTNEVEQPISGKRATLVVAPEQGVTVTQSSQASDGEGKLEATLLAETVGIKTLKIQVGETVFTKTAILIFEAGPVESIELQSEQISLLPEDSAKLTLTVGDKYLNPIKGASVELKTTLGQVSKTTDGEDGTYSATFTAPVQTGKAILSATVLDKTATLVVTVTDQPSLTISPMTAEVELGQTLQFKASEPVIWIVKGGIGTIDSENGLFTATKLGQGKVTAMLENRPTVKVNSQTVTVVEAKLSATALVFDLPKQVEFGAELDLKGQLLVVDQPDIIASNQPIVIAFTNPQEKNLKFAPRTDSRGHYVLDTVVKFNQVGVWQLSFNYAGSSQLAASQRQLAINVNKAKGSIKFLSAESAELGHDYLLVGALQPEVDGAEVELQILGPDSRLIELSLITDAAGGFKHKFKLGLDGRWSATVSWAGDDNYQAVTETFQLNVVKRFGKVIIALGGTGTEETIAWPRVKATAELVHKTFKARRFNPKEDIYFLSSEPSLTEGAQAETTLKTLEFAITNWAGQEVNKNVPLYIYLLSHGLEQNFLVKQEGLQEDYLTRALLDLWLDKLPDGTPVTLIIEACYSGSFIGAPLSGPNRTIITSASADKQAVIGRKSSFSSFFFSEVEKNHTIAEAFEKSKDQMARNSMFFGQSPQIEVNNNGKESEILNLRALKDRRIPADISSRSLRPVFLQQVPPVVLKAGENSHRFKVEIGRMVGSKEEEVTAEIIHPDFDPNRQFLDWKEIEEQIELVELKMIRAEGNSSHYRLEYQEFDQAGEYTIIFQAKNMDGYAEPIQTTVSVIGSQLKGNEGKVVIRFSKINQVQPNQTFDLSVEVDNVEGLAAWAFNLSYDPKILQLKSVSEGDFLSQSDQTTFFSPGQVKEPKGKVVNILSSQVSGKGVKGSGPLLNLVFQALKQGTSTLTLDNVQLANMEEKLIPVELRTIKIVVAESKLTGDVNGDGTVNIFDLVIAAGSFGKTGAGIMGDVNADGNVNIFDLVIVAGNFGQTLAAPSMVVKIELTTDQKQHIASAIDQLKAQPNRSAVEEMALDILQSILPERLPNTTQLLANYPNPFNPETWIPFQLSQDAVVTVTIYDVQGKRIRQLQLGQVTAGRYVTADQAAYWDGKTETGEQVGSGAYFYQLKAGDYTATRKMVILK